MENRLINFHIYRFHLLPINPDGSQLKLFPEKRMSIEEIRERKNQFFAEVLAGLVNSKNNRYPIKLEHSEDKFYLFKIAQKKTATITQNFENLVVDNEPYIYVIINNDPEVQKIAISDNIEAFSSPYVVRNILKKVLMQDLENYGLNIEIEQLFDSMNFWEIVKKHKRELTYINFQFIKPNLANISKSLPEVFKKFANDVNSHESELSIKAPEKGVLNNIVKSNQDIAGLVEYTANGAGSIKVKVKGIRRQINTKEKPVISQIREIEIEGAAEQVIKMYKEIINE